jgi:hypothetical protein
MNKWIESGRHLAMDSALLVLNLNVSQSRRANHIRLRFPRKKLRSR